MNQTSMTPRQQEILNLIESGYCLPREIAQELKANKSNISTVLKFLLDNGHVVREKFYGTYVYALNMESLEILIKTKENRYAKQMKLEKRIFCRR